jgi:Tfp pilus assembly protein PilE
VIELMLVVGIVGIIATIAIPAFIRFQLRTKASEVKSNLSAVRVSEEAYHAEYGVYTSALPVVPTSIGRDKRTWYYQYGVVTSGGGTAFTVGARSNLDGDANFNTWGLVKPETGTSLGIVGPFGTCQATGVFNDNSGAADLLNEIGPCNRFSGKTVF